MKRATYFLGIVYFLLLTFTFSNDIVFLFYFQTSCFGNPVPDPEAAFSTLRVFRYHGEINATNSADNETISRWTVSGKLSVYNGVRRAVFKLDDVKTSVFNGIRSELHHVQEKEIPEEAKVVLQPFEVKRLDVENISIHFLPNEPLWSQNFKRGLASNLDLEVDMKHLREAEKNPGASFKETTLYGHCDVHYKASIDSAIIYERSFSHASCGNSPKKTRSNIPIYSSEYVPDYESKTIKTTTLLDRNGTIMPDQMVTATHLQAKSLLATSYSQYIDQITKLDLLDSNESETEIPIDTSIMTDQRELIYEVGDEPTSGRHSYNTSVADLTKQYLDNYDKFEKYFLHSPIEHIDISKHDAVENMYLALQGLDIDGLKHLEQTIIERKDSYDISNMYFTLLPYVGTQATVKYLVLDISQENKQRTNENDMLQIRSMAVFPNFIENYSDELLEDLEPLMDLKSENFRLPTGRNAGPLSFASAVARTGRSGKLSKTKNDKYTKLYHQKFLESETHEERMIYLLGLINMYNTDDLHLMNNIITNTTESKHIRTLALAGFQHLLQHSDVTKLFDGYWPIVQNNVEPFDLRVRALDLLLSANLTEEQFNTIINKYSLHFSDPQDKHLANYILTSLHSLQNTTHFKDYLGSKASEALKTTQIPSMGTFSTGNYRLAHTDNNMGAYLQARVISDPSTNIINSIQVTYKSYGFSSELNGYSLYLNIDGLFEAQYAHQFLRRLRYTDDVTSVPELLAALKENHFELESIFKNKDCHIDIVVFKDNTAVYAAHFEWFDKWQMMYYMEEVHLLLRISLSVQFPLINYMQMPSDLGTPLQFSNGIEDITYIKVVSERDYFIYRSTWNYQSWIESYNPLVDTNIATYKYFGIDRNLGFTYNTWHYWFSWVNKNDSFVMYTDNIMGTSVEDENILKQYCENCESYIDVPPQCSTMDRIRKFEPFGFKVNLTGEGNTVESCVSSPPDSAIEYYFTNKDYKSNIDAFPKAGPIMYLTHVYNHKILLVDDLSRVSYRSIPLFDEDTETSINKDISEDFMLEYFNPMAKKSLNFTIEIQNKINHRKISSSWKADYKLVLDPEYTDDSGKKHYAYLMSLNLKHIAAPDNDSYNSYKICAKRELFFPSLRSDKYSLDPVEPATGKFVWTISKDLEGEDGTCTPSKVFIFTDTYSATNKAEKLKIKQNKKDYDECMENSKDLHFTAPTNACRRISARLAEYDNYKLHLTEKIYPKEEGGEIRTLPVKEPLIKYSRDGNDYMKLAINKVHSNFEIDESYYKTIYNPVTVNPLAMAYVDSISVPPFIANSKCTIAPSGIEQFSGKYTPNQNTEWLAFAECYNITRIGLIGHTIDEHHIGFTYRSHGTVFTATVTEGKLNVGMDGKELHKSIVSKEYKVNFLDDNVINILDKKVNIYYNTEYLQVTVNALYTKLLCGICT